MSLNMLVNSLVLLCTRLLEWRDRGEIDALVAGDMAINGTFVLCWTAAAGLLRNA